MKREDVLKFLTAIFSTILIHDALISELSAIIERSGFEKKFFKMLMARLRYLEEFGASAINYREGFESLTHQADGLYSMRLKGSNFNIRILYAFLPDGASHFAGRFWGTQRKTGFFLRILYSCCQRTSEAYFGGVKS